MHVRRSRRRRRRVPPSSPLPLPTPPLNREPPAFLTTSLAPLFPLPPLDRELAGDYADKRPLVVGTLKGAVVFMADLVRAIEPVPAGLSLEFIRASSYGAGTVSSGKVALGGTLAAADIAGRHVLLVGGTP